MYSEDNDEINRKDLESKLERFLNHSQFYLNRLLLIKSQLHDIKRLNQPNFYKEKLSKLKNTIPSCLLSFLI
jgi:hypothetical protein